MDDLAQIKGLMKKLDFHGVKVEVDSSFSEITAWSSSLNNSFLLIIVKIILKL